jgi:hypothetical protein
MGSSQIENNLRHPRSITRWVRSASGTRIVGRNMNFGKPALKVNPIQRNRQKPNLRDFIQLATFFVVFNVENVVAIRQVL